MNIAIFLITATLVLLLFIGRLVERADRQFAAISVLAFLAISVPALHEVNRQYGLSDQIDDDRYFSLSSVPFNTIEEVVDLNRFQGQMEQPGYPWVLTIITTLFGADLFTYKLLNLYFLVTTAIVWYRIGYSLGGNHFARCMLLSILLFPPLWYYFIILRKDMLIVLIQSYLLLLTIQLSDRFNVGLLLGFALASAFLVMLRSALVAQSAMVCLSFLLLQPSVERPSKGRLVASALGITLSILLLFAFSNKSTLSELGIQSDHRVVGSAEMYDYWVESETPVARNPLVFALIYFLSETAILNAQTWETLDFPWLRALLTAFWGLVYAPFAILGLCSVVIDIYKSAVHANDQSPSQATTRKSPWLAVLIFIGSSVMISYLVGDTTRWRVSDFPMWIALAVRGWNSCGFPRATVFCLWNATFFLTMIIYYANRGD